jgi:hypothetical protein
MPKKNKPPVSFTGLTLEQWRSDVPHLRWAQREPIFREILSVIQNESYLALAPLDKVTENRMLGRAEGYAMALEVLRAMAVKIEKPIPQIEPTYEAETDKE